MVELGMHGLAWVQLFYQVEGELVTGQRDMKLSDELMKLQ